MFGPAAHAHTAKLECDKAESVLAAIEMAWKQHHRAGEGIVIGFYTHLAQRLNEEGFIVDTLDGLEILEHCRRRNLAIVDVLYALEDRIRADGYRAKRLGLADFNSGTTPVYVFYDPGRFKTFTELKHDVAQRLASAPAKEAPPSS
ncbi:MAG: hypothetical protein AB7E79_09440 [Rhodospirillaceae bacterium]